MNAEHASAPVVTLTTDFGTRNPYVAAMKGVVLARCPGARVVDLSHEIAPQDVLEGALFLAAAVPHFPPGTVHVAVIDPGVGTARRAIAARLGAQTLVCPDNGLPTLLERALPPTAAHAITSRDFMRDDVSATFHGRDVFAPAGARLAAGAPLASAGPAVPLADLVRLDVPTPHLDARGGAAGVVIHVDRFGNAITNLRATDLPALPDACVAGGTRVRVVRTYGDVPAGAPLALIGSSGLLEVAVNRGSAAKTLGLRRGDAVSVDAGSRAGG